MYMYVHRPCISSFSVLLTWLYVVGYFRRASSVSKFGGSLLRISAATSSNVSSLDLPPPLDVRAYRQTHIIIIIIMTRTCACTCTCTCMHVIDLCEKNTVEELVCLLLVLGDVSVSVHPKHLRVRDDRKRLDII